MFLLECLPSVYHSSLKLTVFAGSPRPSCTFLLSVLIRHPALSHLRHFYILSFRLRNYAYLVLKVPTPNLPDSVFWFFCFFLPAFQFHPKYLYANRLLLTTKFCRSSYGSLSQHSCFFYYSA